MRIDRILSAIVAASVVGSGFAERSANAACQDKQPPELRQSTTAGQLAPDDKQRPPVPESSIDDRLRQALEHLASDREREEELTDPEEISARVRELVGQLDDPWKRGDAFWALERMGPTASAATPALRKLLKAESRSLVQRAMQTLVKIAPADKARSAEFLADLKHADADRRLAAAGQLWWIVWENRFCEEFETDIPPIMAALTAALRDDNRHVRLVAVIGLDKCGVTLSGEGPELMRLLENDPSPGIRAAVADALRESGLKQPAIVAALVKATRDRDAQVREAAVQVIADGRCRASDLVVPALIEALDDEWVIRFRAVCGLSDIGDRAAPAVPAICRLLNDHCTDSPASDAGDLIPAGELIRALGSIVGGTSSHRREEMRSPLDGTGRHDDPAAAKNRVSDEHVDLAVSALVAALTYKYDANAGEAAGALARIGPRAKKAVGTLRSALGHKSPRVRVGAARVLEHVGPPAKPAVAELLAALEDEEAEVRGSVVQALGSVAADSKDVPAHLARMLADESEDVRENAGLSLLGCGDEGIRLLCEALDAKDAPVAVAAAKALGRSENQTGPIATALGQALRHEATEVRSEAARALARFGTAALPAKHALLDVVRNDQPRAAVASTVGALSRLGIDHNEAPRLAELRVGDDRWLAAKVLSMLVPFPVLALKFLQANPAAVSDINARTLRHVVSLTDKESAALRQAILDHPDLPSTVMAWSGDKRHLPVLDVRIAAAESRDRLFLEGCARACGRITGEIIQVAEGKPVEFRPPSCMSGGDRRRMPPNFYGGHGDGYVEVIVTGKIVMPNGRPARGVRACDPANRMLAPQHRRDPLPFMYCETTGRFVFLAEISAVYARPRGEQPGPFSTGGGGVTIEAEGAKPFRLLFFDEMPDVEITLTPAKPDAAKTCGEQ